MKHSGNHPATYVYTPQLYTKSAAHPGQAYTVRVEPGSDLVPRFLDPSTSRCACPRRDNGEPDLGSMFMFPK